MPAPTAQHSRTATGWPYQVRSTNASSTSCEATTAKGSRMSLSSKPNITNPLMKPRARYTLKTNDYVTKHDEPQTELNLGKVPGTPLSGQPQDQKAKAPNGIMRRHNHLKAKSKRRSLGPATPNTMTTYWTS